MSDATTSVTTRISGGHVLAWEGGDHVLLADAEVVYRDSTIVHVGHGFDGPVDEEIDATGQLVMPGLIDLDALTDIDHCLLDSWSDTEDFLWSPEYATRSRHVFTQEERATVREYAIAQLARHGVTTFMPIASEIHSDWAETAADFRDVAAITRRIGLRGYLGPSYRSGVPVSDREGRRVHWDEERGREGLADALAFLDEAVALGSDLVHGVLLPCRIETLSLDLMRATAQAARERGVLVRLHCLQGSHEEPLLRERYGLGVVDALESTGLLDVDLLVPHGTQLGDLRDPAVVAGADVQRLVKARVPIIHCPLTSARYGGGLRSFEAYRAAGLRIVLGTDSFPPDLLRGIDVGVQIAKITDRSRAAGRIEHYLHAATNVAADVLHRPDLGRLAVGASADVVIADLGDFATGVVDDPVRTLVVNGSGRDVVRTVVAGRTVMLDGDVLGTDVADLARRAQLLFESMREAYGERDAAGRSADELFPPAFPTRSSVPLPVP
jgi:8-oxoguanine deaminase